MKVPDIIRIAGIDYKITHEPKITQDGHLLYGQINYDDCLILLSSTDGIAHDKQCVTLLHEILHGIIESAQMELEDEEKTCEVLARGLYQVIKDNESSLFGK